MPEQPSKLAIVSHDAGGAEILSSFVRRNHPPCLLVLDGPADKIFRRKIGAIRPVPLVQALHEAGSILCGSSWQSDLEYNAIRLARSVGKPSVAFLDHWVSYKERFQRAGVICLPDEIWVGDEIARGIATAAFPGVPVRVVMNPYVEDIREQLAAIPSPSTGRREISVLYVCEPVRDHALKLYGNERHWGYTEEDALRYFLSNIAVLGKPARRVVVRPHPAEPADKYAWAAAEFNMPITFDASKTLIEEVVESDVVVGCGSMAMVVGLIAGKRVISCIPPGGNDCALPQPEIEHLRRLL